MSKHIENDELSAYLDGESSRADAVKHHMDSCGECSDVYTEYSGLSDQLKALPQLEVHPSFSRRVLASVMDAKPKRAPWQLPLGVSLGTAMAAALVALVVIPMNNAQLPAPVITAQAPQTIESKSAAFEIADEAELIAKFERHFAEENEFTRVLISAYAPERVSASIDANTIVMAMSDSAAVDTVSDRWLPSGDIRSIVNGMDDSEKALLKKLLLESTRAETPRKG